MRRRTGARRRSNSRRRGNMPGDIVSLLEAEERLQAPAVTGRRRKRRTKKRTSLILPWEQDRPDRGDGSGEGRNGDGRYREGGRGKGRSGKKHAGKKAALEDVSENDTERSADGESSPDVSSILSNLLALPAIGDNVAAGDKTGVPGDADRSGDGGEGGSGESLALLRTLMAKGLDLERIEKEVARLKSNVHRMESMAREADSALDSLVRTMGYFGIKPKRGTWVYNRMRRLEEQDAAAAAASSAPAPAGTGVGGLDLGAMMNLASMFLGKGGGGTAAAAPASRGIMGTVMNLMKSPTVQNLVLDGIARFLKK
ncbi:hypothetical protein HM1_0424 [Heliomicrobium modesticaldum Ice1]|uniref:Uncharacterized protein n=1 Tax=Heliobacterium modesticaldum (strain ATCC 51547 / Ice1) TaxID=498761 RepID=B0TFE2_HELMI|nr:hypothetical protein [Heliomicrobium modesticaldum]ABZ83041.1 hypothetical protein HM1_0424 [Heliomicrobium modesticaldum Ice1]